MLQSLKNTSLMASAAFFTGAMASREAQAGGNNVNTLADNLVTSIDNLPNLITAISYLAGIMMAVLGVLKIKDHVEDPRSTQLKDGAIRLAVAGGLFSIPFLTDVVSNTIGQSNEAGQSNIQQLNF